MWTKKCLVCQRDFAPESHQCYQCQLPLYDTAETVVIQQIELGRIINTLLRRYKLAMDGLREPVVRRAQPEKRPIISRLRSALLL